MNTQAITAKILEDARTQVEQLISQADQRAARLREEAEAQLAKKQGEAEAEARAQIADLRDRMLRMAELDQKKALLAVKRQVIDAAFEDALSRMRAMCEADKRRYIASLLADSAAGGEELIVSKEEENLYDAAFLGRINERLAASGKHPVALADARELGGGFVLKSGGMEINCTYSAVVEQARPALESEVAGMLFGQTSKESG